MQKFDRRPHLARKANEESSVRLDPNRGGCRSSSGAAPSGDRRESMGKGVYKPPWATVVISKRTPNTFMEIGYRFLEIESLFFFQNSSGNPKKRFWNGLKGLNSLAEIEFEWYDRSPEGPRSFAFIPYLRMAGTPSASKLEKSWIFFSIFINGSISVSSKICHVLIKKKPDGECFAKSAQGWPPSKKSSSLFSFQKKFK